MQGILGEGFDKSFAEEIIYYVTLFASAKKILKSALKEIQNCHGIQLSEEQLEAILKLKYQDWGRLSKALLKDIRGVAGDFRESNIITYLEETDMNFMELLSSHNTFIDSIRTFNKEFELSEVELSEEVLVELNVSPAVKRAIWQSLKILEEIIRLQGYPPSKVFVEVTRSNKSVKKATTTRKKYLMELYNDIKKIKINGLRK